VNRVGVRPNLRACIPLHARRPSVRASEQTSSSEPSATRARFGWSSGAAPSRAQEPGTDAQARLEHCLHPGKGGEPGPPRQRRSCSPAILRVLTNTHRRRFRAAGAGARPRPGSTHHNNSAFEVLSDPAARATDDEPPDASLGKTDKPAGSIEPDGGEHPRSGGGSAHSARTSAYKTSRRTWRRASSAAPSRLPESCSKSFGTFAAPIMARPRLGPRSLSLLKTAA
jgi:hypothetical protein